MKASKGVCSVCGQRFSDCTLPEQYWPDKCIKHLTQRDVDEWLKKVPLRYGGSMRLLGMQAA